MSILIKGMAMPKTCKECPLSVVGYNEVTGDEKRLCLVIPTHFEKTVEKYPDCPLIEIDDELYEKAVNAYVLQQVRCGNVDNH